MADAEQSHEVATALAQHLASLETSTAGGNGSAAVEANQVTEDDEVGEAVEKDGRGESAQTST